MLCMSHMFFCTDPILRHVSADCPGLYYLGISRMSFCYILQQFIIVSKGAKIRNRYNQVPHLTQDTNGKVTNSQLYTTNEGQQVSPFRAGDHKAQINRRAQRHNKHKAENIKYPQKKHRLGTSVKYFTGWLKPVSCFTYR